MAISLYSGLTQVVITGLIAFACPGLFNALQGLGATGGCDPLYANAANVGLYASFSIFGYLGGGFFALFGPRVLMGVGGLTYSFYAISAYLVGEDQSYGWLFVLAGVLLGMGAGCLWTAQGALMLAYPPPAEKGRYISIFWVIFNLGGCLGGLLQFFLNYHEESQAGAASYFVFVGIMTAGSLGAFFFIKNPEKVRKTDGSSVVLPPKKKFFEEFSEVAQVLKDRNMHLLTPLFFGSNFFYPYVFNCVNLPLFNIRTRGLNSALYWLAQMVGAVVIGKVLDPSSAASSSAFTRAKRGLIAVGVACNVAYAFGFFLQSTYKGGYEKHRPLEGAPLDFMQLEGWVPIFGLILYGFSESFLQAFAYWVMGALACGDASLSARYSGYYKGMQSVGAAVSWLLNLPSLGLSFSAQFWTCWLLLLVSIPPSFLVVKRIQEGEGRGVEKGRVVSDK